MTQRKASPETMARLCEAVRLWLHCQPSIVPSDATRDALSAYRAETTPPLRSRAEVDAEIVTCIRMAYGSGVITVRNPGGDMSKYVEELCAEPTAPEPAPEGDRNNGCPDPGSTVEPGWPRFVHNFAKRYKPAKDPTVERALDCDLPDPEPCGCEETEALRKVLSEAYRRALSIEELLRTIP